MVEGSPVGILVLIGVPGTGKSTFSTQYKKHVNDDDLNVVHVCYDQLVPLGNILWSQPNVSISNRRCYKWSLNDVSVYFFLFRNALLYMYIECNGNYLGIELPTEKKYIIPRVVWTLNS